MHEEEKEEWAKEIEKHAEMGVLPKMMLCRIEKTYDQIVQRGLEYHAQLTPLLRRPRGKAKQRNGKNLLLLNRLQGKRAPVLCCAVLCFGLCVNLLFLCRGH